MASHGSAGIWDRDGAPLDPTSLPLSPTLRRRLARWCARFQDSFETEIAFDAFATEGRTIALQVWSIVYFYEAAAARTKYRGAPIAYHAEPTNSAALSTFRYYVVDLWRRSQSPAALALLTRMRDGELARGIRDQVEWMRFTVIVNPVPHSLIIGLVQGIQLAVSGVGDA